MKTIIMLLLSISMYSQTHFKGDATFNYFSFGVDQTIHKDLGFETIFFEYKSEPNAYININYDIINNDGFMLTPSIGSTYYGKFHYNIMSSYEFYEDYYVIMSFNKISKFTLGFMFNLNTNTSGCKCSWKNN